jgi:hypothetical protein
MTLFIRLLMEHLRAFAAIKVMRVMAQVVNATMVPAGLLSRPLSAQGR